MNELMSKSMKQADVAQEGRLISRFFRLVGANVLSNLMVPLATIFSTAFLGHLAEIHHLAGVALAGNLFSFLFMLLVSLRMSTTGLTAQATGRDDREEIILVVVRNSMVAFGCGIALIGFQYPIGQLGLAWVNASSEVIGSAIAYFNAAIWSAPATLLNYVLLGWFLGREKNTAVLVLSAIASISNIGFDYLFIIQLNFASAGAGVAVVMSQYLTLVFGVGMAFQEIKWQDFKQIAGKILNRSALTKILSLNTNILISNLMYTLVLLMFSYAGIGLGVTTYTQNALLMEIVYFNSFLAEGIGFGVETLSGNCKGKGAASQLPALIGVAITTSLSIGLAICGLVIIFPQTLFGLFTNHSELVQQIDAYTIWLLPIIGLTSIAFVLECYFLGITAGKIVKNVSLFSFFVGFVPAVLVALGSGSNHLLWLSFCLFLVARIVGFGVLLPQALKNEIDTSVAISSAQGCGERKKVLN